jgi:hypothetical protein
MNSSSSLSDYRIAYPATATVHTLSQGGSLQGIMLRVEARRQAEARRLARRAALARSLHHALQVSLQVSLQLALAPLRLIGQAFTHTPVRHTAAVRPAHTHTHTHTHSHA